MLEPEVYGGKADQSRTPHEIYQIDHIMESGQVADRVIAIVAAPSESRPTINYILGGPSESVKAPIEEALESHHR